MNKYGAKKTDCANGHKHDSKREAKRCDELHLLQRGRVISDLRVQPKYEFAIDGEWLMMLNGQRAKYTPDFAYVEKGRQIAEDVKGMVTEAFRLRAALFRHLFTDIELRVLK